MGRAYPMDWTTLWASLSGAVDKDRVLRGDDRAGCPVCGELNQRDQSDFTTTSLGPVSLVPSKDAASTVTAAGCSDGVLPWRMCVHTFPLDCACCAHSMDTELILTRKPLLHSP
jgi:hypothetical protein